MGSCGNSANRPSTSITVIIRMTLQNKVRCMTSTGLRVTSRAHNVHCHIVPNDESRIFNWVMQISISEKTKSESESSWGGVDWAFWSDGPDLEIFRNRPMEDVLEKFCTTFRSQTLNFGHGTLLHLSFFSFIVTSPSGGVYHKTKSRCPKKWGGSGVLGDKERAKWHVFEKLPTHLLCCNR